MRAATEPSAEGQRVIYVTDDGAPFSQIGFCQETLRVSDSSSAHHQEFYTVHMQF